MSRKKTKLTQERLRELLDYDAETGVFRWRVRRRKIQLKAIAGGRATNGYWQICLDYHIYAAHRLVFLYLYGSFPIMEVDHVNGAKSDNRRSNLREAARSQNMMNTGIRTDNTSGSRGVSWLKCAGKWRARIWLKSKEIHLGLYESKSDASCAYDAAANKLFGEFKRLI